jgi:hypothetical protein
MLQQRTNRSQACVKVVAALRTWGRSVTVPRKILPFPDCVKDNEKALLLASRCPILLARYLSDSGICTFFRR